MLVPVLLAALQAAPPPPNAGNPPTPRPEVVIDLLKITPGSPVSVPAPGAMFQFRLENAAPGAAYRATVEVGGTQPSVRMVDVGLNATGLESMLRILPTSDAACDRAQRQGQDLLKTTDEAQVPVRVAALETAIAERVCPLWESRFLHQISLTRPRVDSVVLDRNAPDAPVKVKVERLDRASGAVQKQWQVAASLKTERRPWRYADEEDWLVTAISERIADLLRPSLAAGAVTATRSSASTPSAPQYAVTVALQPPVSRTVTLADHVWDPRAYAPLAAAVLSAGKAEAGPLRSEGSAIVALLDLRASTIQKENQRVSAWLGRERTNPIAHEQAALVIGALALRENADDFWDARPLLNRLTAHLAVAEALRDGGAPSLDGQIAGAVLASVAGREKDALDRLARIKPASPSAPEAAWVRALTIRNTRDWRLLTEPAKATLLERLEHYRAVNEAVGSGAALTALDARQPEPIVDWAHMALAGGVSLEEGHRFARSAIDLEMNDAKDVWRSFRGRELPPSELSSALNDESPGHEVLDWATWAGYFQRHLGHLIEAVEEFYGRMLGLTDQAEEFRKQATASFGALQSYPITQLRWSMQPRRAPQGPVTTDLRRSSCTAAALLPRDHPERLAPISWDQIDRLCRADAAEAAGIPPFTNWFTSVFPRGTVLDPSHRLHNIAAYKALDLPMAEQLLALAPRQHLVLLAYVGRRYGAKPRPEDLKSAYGSLMEYDTRALAEWAEAVRREPEPYREVAGRKCDLDPDSCVDFATHLFGLELDDAAMVAFQRAHESARDRLAVANASEWPMHYYFDRRQLDKARQLAEEAAEMGSARGFAILGRLLERMGKYPEAEAYYRKIAQRYESTREVDEFYIRRDVREHDGRYRALAADALKRYFPQGLQRVSIASFTTPPSPTGDLVIAEKSLSAKSRKYGLQPNDRIVALDGYRVDNWDQYLIVHTFSDAPRVSTIVWRDGRYFEIQGTFTRRWYGP